MDVSDVLRDRMREPAGLQRMVTVSIAAHVVLVALILLAPGAWWSHVAGRPETVMTVSLGGGAPGPQNGGVTPLGGRPVQTTTELPRPPRREAIRPPAAKPPEMTIPKPGSRPVKAAPAPKVTEAPEGARGRTPTKGEKPEAGSAVAETGARGQGFGLSTGGAAGSGSYLDVGDFCCPDYLVTMSERIRANWSPRAEVPGDTIVRFVIQRDGQITDPTVEKSSGYTALDLTAQRAIYMTRQLPPLPAAFPNPTLTVHLNFHYQR